MVVHLGKLASHLCGHEGVGNMVSLEIVVQGYQVEAYFLGDDIHRGTSGQGRIHIHHAGIEAVAGIGSHMVAGLQVVVAAIPVAEHHQVTMLQHATLGYSR